MSRNELWEAVLDKIDLRIEAENSADEPNVEQIDELSVDRKAVLAHATHRSKTVSAEGSRGVVYCAVDGEPQPCVKTEELADKYEVTYSPTQRGGSAG